MIEKIINIEQMEEMRHNALKDPMILSISFERYDDNHVRVRVVTSDYPIHKQCSIIRWTRYTGHEDTRPDYDKDILFAKDGQVVMTTGGSLSPSNIPGFYKFDIGDLWAYLPIPEGI